MCPFSILAFLQPTTVDKEPAFFGDKRLLSQTQILAFLQPTIVDNEPLKISSTKMQSFFL